MSYDSIYMRLKIRRGTQGLREGEMWNYYLASTVAVWGKKKNSGKSNDYCPCCEHIHATEFIVHLKVVSMFFFLS